jgi:organic radical activating enzyme
MNPSLKSKSCTLKAQQKTFYLQQNQVSSCCRARSDILDSAKDLDFYLQKWQEESQMLDQGVEIAGCDMCWRQEAQGQLSYRLTNQGFNQIELYLSNLCNQMCSYCSPKFSSAWEHSLHEQGMFRNISASARQNLHPSEPPADTEYWIRQISDYLQTQPSQSVVVKLLGGEPLMQQRNLETLLKFNVGQIKTLAVHTNLNPPNNKFLLWLLENMDCDRLIFTVSIDANPEFNHWPRARFDKDQFEINLDTVKKHKVAVDINAVISVLSVFDLPAFVGWAKDQQIPINFAKLYNPNCLDPVLIPSEFRKRIAEQIPGAESTAVVREVLDAPTVIDPIRLIEQHNYLTQYFERNNLDPQQCNNDLFQQYWTWLTDNYKNRTIHYETSYSK